MSEKDFVVENGVLEKYTGSDENFVVPKGITEIADYAFDCCEDMVDVEFPDTVREIGEKARRRKESKAKLAEVEAKMNNYPEYNK